MIWIFGLPILLVTIFLIIWYFSEGGFYPGYFGPIFGFSFVLICGGLWAGMMLSNFIGFICPEPFILNKSKKYEIVSLSDDLVKTVQEKNKTFYSFYIKDSSGMVLLKNIPYKETKISFKEDKPIFEENLYTNRKMTWFKSCHSFKFEKIIKIPENTTIK